MAYYQHDYKLEDAMKIAESPFLSEREELLMYYIQKQKERIEEKDRQLEIYRDFFEQMYQLLPGDGLNMPLR